MLGVIITLVLGIACVGVGSACLRRYLRDLDPSLRFGTAGLAGLGLLGTVTFFLGLVPNGFHWGVWLVAAYGVVGVVFPCLEPDYRKLRFPKGPAAIALLVLVVFGAFALVSVLAPSTADDWDTLAYHLAVPKLWLEAGHMFSVPSLHHSNFPDVIDDLYVWGLTWGGQSGAKAFSLSFYLLGLPAVFGFARQRYGANAGWWATLAYASVPALVWEAGTAYIDLGHGLFAGLGLLFAAEFVRLRGESDEGSNAGASCAVLSGVMLGFAAASKYTGLEAIFVVVAALICVGLFRKRLMPYVAAANIVWITAIALALPWYVKNLATVANPVYPFLYERLGGLNWDQRRADIYRREQQSFGVGLKEPGGRDVTQLGGAVLGLAYQPGRFVNPGQTQGLGSPSGAVGVSVLAGLLIWPAFGVRKRRFEGFLVGTAAVSLLGWFFLSQQSRYLTTLAPPGAILLGGAVATLPLGVLAAFLTAFQTGYSLWFFQSGRFTDQVQVVLGKIPSDAYLLRRIPFYEASQKINKEVPKTGKVALYDEVFGYLLDVPYMWANPGHSTIIPYDAMQSGDDFVAKMKELGFTHVYLNLSPQVKDQRFAQRWLRAMGQYGPVVPFTGDERAQLWNDWETKWEVLVAEAAASGKLRLQDQFRSGVLFAL